MVRITYPRTVMTSVIISLCHYLVRGTRGGSRDNHAPYTSACSEPFCRLVRSKCVYHRLSTWLDSWIKVANEMGGQILTWHINRGPCHSGVHGVPFNPLSLQERLAQVR